MRLDSQQPYNDTFDIKKQFQQYMFIDNKPLFQSELNGVQASSQAQEQLLGDLGAKFHNGAILSGLRLQSTGPVTDETADNSNPNLFKYSTFGWGGGSTAGSNSHYNNGHGELLFQGGASSNTEPMYISFSYPNNTDNDGHHMETLSFDITEMGSSSNAELDNIGLKISDAGSVVQEAEVDGATLQTDLTNDKGDALVDTAGNQIDLSDGNTHQVIVTFNNEKANQSNPIAVQILFNYGFPSMIDTCNVRIDNFKIEAGPNVTAWQPYVGPDENDAGMGGSGNRKQGYYVSPGFVYLYGYFRWFQGGHINLTNVGDEIIGLSMTQSVVTANDDKELVDDTPGSPTDNQTGSARLKYNLSLVYASGTTYPSTGFVPIYWLNNGSVTRTSNSGYDRDLLNLLARRTYDQSGSYRVNGLQMSATPDEDPDLIDIKFAPGVAYVMGYQVNSTNNMITLPVENDYTDPNNATGTERDDLQFHLNTGEVKLNNSAIDVDTEDNKGISVYSTVHDYNPGYDPSEEIDDGNYKGIEIDGGNPGAIGDVVPLPKESNVDPSLEMYVTNDPAGQGQKFYYSDSGTPDTFDLTIESDGSNVIQWSGQPPVEDTYYLHCSIDKYFKGPYDRPGLRDRASDVDSPVEQHGQSGEDYMVVQKDDNGNIVWTSNDSGDYHDLRGHGAFYLVFSSSRNSVDDNGKHLTNYGLNSEPDDNANVVVKYDAYKSREDKIVLDQNGVFSSIQGQPGFVDEVQPPYDQDPYSLTLGYVYVYPNSQAAYCETTAITRVPYSEINDMMLSIDNLKQNVDINSLRQAAIDHTDPQTLKDTFSDRFDTLDKADVTAPDFNIAYSPDHYITPGWAAEGSVPITYNVAANPEMGNGLRSRDVNGLITNSYKEVAVPELSQPYVSSSYTVNNGGLITMQGSLSLSQDSDTWTDCKSRVKTQLNPMIMSTSQANNPADSAWRRNINLDEVNGHRNNYLQYGHLYTGHKQLYKHTATTAEYYIRSRRITFVVKGVRPNSSGYQVLMDKTPVDDVQGRTVNGFNYNDSVNGRLKADNQGFIYGSFVIPKYTVPCGKQDVQVTNGYNFADAPYTAYGKYALTTTKDMTSLVYINDNQQIHDIRVAMVRNFMYIQTQISELSNEITQIQEFDALISQIVAEFHHQMLAIADYLNDRINSGINLTKELASALNEKLDNFEDAVHKYENLVNGVLAAHQSEIQSNTATINSVATSAANRFASDESTSYANSVEASEKESADISNVTGAVQSLSASDYSGFISANASLNGVTYDLTSLASSVAPAITSLGDGIAENANNITGDAMAAQEAEDSLATGVSTDSETAAADYGAASYTNSVDASSASSMANENWMNIQGTNPVREIDAEYGGNNPNFGGYAKYKTVKIGRNGHGTAWGKKNGIGTTADGMAWKLARKYFGTHEMSANNPLLKYDKSQAAKNHGLWFQGVNIVPAHDHMYGPNTASRLQRYWRKNDILQQVKESGPVYQQRHTMRTSAFRGRRRRRRRRR